jgi:hypothetical protein
MKGYLQLKLDKDSSDKLKKKAKYPQIFSHHVTIIFGVSEDDERVKELLNIGDMVIRGKEIYTDDKGQALSVDMLSDFVSLNEDQKNILKENGKKQNYHVTISTQDGVKPVYSNDLLKNPEANREPFTETLRGTMEFFPFGRGN